MINHVRTVLLNMPANEARGGEFIPPEFRPMELTGLFKAVYAVLFGTYGDPVYRNYRVAQYMEVLAANIYSAQLLTLYDHRRTDVPGAGWYEMDFSEDIASDAQNTAELRFIGDFQYGRPAGRMEYRWMVRVVYPDQLEVKDGANTAVRDLTFDSGVAQTDLPATGGTQPVSISSATPLLPGSFWTVTALIRPRRDLAAIYGEVRNISGISSIFQNTPETYYNLWRKGTNMVDRLGALLAAYVWRLVDLRNER